MATSPVSLTLPFRSHFNPIDLQVWVKWTVSHPILTTIIGLAAAVFFSVLYHIVLTIFRSSKFQHITPFPNEQLTNLCFIRIDRNCIQDIHHAQEIKVIIEDSQERRVATRYLDRNDENKDIVALLPKSTSVRVRLEMTRNNRQNPEITTLGSFYTHEDSARYLVHGDRIRLVERVTKVADGQIWRPSFQNKEDYPGTIGIHADLSQLDTDRIVDFDRGSIILIGRDNAYKVVKIALKQGLINDAPDISVLYPLMDGIQKRPSFYCFVKDWIAAYELQAGGRKFRRHHIPEIALSSHFYIDSMICDTYQSRPEEDP